MSDTFDSVARKAVMRCPAMSLLLAYDFVRNSFHDIVERRRWSWMLKRGQLFTTNEYNTGSASITAGTRTVTLTTGVVAATMIGQQFRVGVQSLIATITDADTGANTLTLDQDWYPSTATNLAYSIYTAYVALPSDFHAFVSVIDPSFAQPVPYNLTVAQIDGQDPQRASAGSPPSGLAWLDYYNNLPRYELWPHQRSAYVYPVIYESRPIEPFESGAVIPTLLPSDVILERTMMYCAMWPGETKVAPNPYFDLKLAQAHKIEYEQRINKLEKQDNEHMQQNIWYHSDEGRRRSILSGTWMQSHDLAT